MNAKRYSKQLIRFGLLATLLFAAVALAPAGPAYAANITVDSTADNLTAGDSNCTLREAIMNANSDSDTTGGDCTAGSGADTITLPAGTYTLSLAGAGENANASGDLDVTDDLTINGADAATTIIDGNAADRVFHIAGGTVTLNDLTVQNGATPEGSPGIGCDSEFACNGNGGNSQPGGGIYNAGNLTGNRLTVTSNRTGNGGAGAEATCSTTGFLGCSVVGGDSGSGGGIYSSGTLTVNSSTISQNQTGAAGDGGDLSCTDTAECESIGGDSGSGGGISHVGSLTVNNSNISQNQTGAEGRRGVDSCDATAICSTYAGRQGGGGGIIDGAGASTMTIADSILENNNGYRGGAVHQQDAIVSITASQFSNNSAGLQAGAVYCLDNVSDCTITESTFTGNSAAFSGGAVLCKNGDSAGSQCTIIGSTFVNNNAASRGGAIHFVYSGFKNISNSTISGNSSDDGAGIYVSSGNVNIDFVTIADNAADSEGGGIFQQSGTVNLQNSIVGDNTAPTAPDISGNIQSQDYNLIEATSGATISGATANNLTGIDPGLGALADNGGPTLTQAPDPSSPATDHIPSSVNDCDITYPTDQRGVSRPQGSACDIGAVERVSAVTPGANGGDGPGGVGVTDGSSALEMWLRGDRGVFSDAACSTSASGGGSAGCWQDQSGNGYHVTQSTAGSRPVYQTGLINSRAGLQFDGSDDYLQKAWESDLNPATLSVYGLWQTTGGSGTVRSPLTSRVPGEGWNFYADDINDWQFWTGTGSGWSSVGTTPSTLDQWVLLNGTYDGTIQAIYADGALNESATRSYAQNPSAPLYVGVGAGGTNYYFSGDIAEVTVYSEAHNDVERILVENYLSAKYGVALDTAGGATDVYDGDTAGNGDFDLDVAGIGQTAGNQHTQAHGAGMIVVDDGFLQDDGDWLLFGHNVASNDNTTDDWTTGPDPRRWSRHWYIDVTDANSNGGTVDIIFDYSEAGMDGDAADLPSTPASNYRLLKRSGATGAFSDITAASGATVVISGDQVQFLGVDVAQLGSNFTLGTLDYGSSPTAVSLQSLSAQESNAGGALLYGVLSLAVLGLTFWLRRRYR